MIKLFSTFTMILAFSLNASASDVELDRLKLSFATLIKDSTVFLDLAATMKPISVKQGVEITKSDCIDLQSKIKANYQIDPFEFIHEDGASFNYMCGGQWGWRKNYILNQSGTTNMGLPYTMIVQLPDDPSMPEFLVNYFIDSSYRIVEIEGIITEFSSKKILGYRIISVDKSDNLYISVFDEKYTITGGAKDVSGVHTMEKFIPSDGSSPFGLLRNTVRNISDSSKDYQILLLDRADRTDWQSYQTQITHEYGYYNYGGKYYSSHTKPTYRSTLTIKYRGNKEYCAYGSIKEDLSWKSFPLNQKEREDCGNY